MLISRSHALQREGQGGSIHQDRTRQVRRNSDSVGSANPSTDGPNAGPFLAAERRGQQGRNVAAWANVGETGEVVGRGAEYPGERDFASRRELAHFGSVETAKSATNLDKIGRPDGSPAIDNLTRFTLLSPYFHPTALKHRRRLG